MIEIIITGGEKNASRPDGADQDDVGDGSESGNDLGAGILNSAWG